jgi:hypothetical protein
MKKKRKRKKRKRKYGMKYNMIYLNKFLISHEDKEYYKKSFFRRLIFLKKKV